jgi:2-dehydro-3-deoxygluconokinase
VELVTPVEIVCVGEAMLELSARDGGWHLGHGGDTLNTAIHLARAGRPTAHLTALGTDPFSAGLVEACRAEGLDTVLMLAHPARHVGLYAVSTDPAGERSFTYWRSDSAAREMFELPGIDAAEQRAADARVLLFSLISLAILPDAGRARLLRLAERVRGNGGLVVFDGNYRPRLWDNRDEAAEWRDRAAAVADIGLPTLEDETALGLPADPDRVAAHWQALGCAETVVKLGARGCRLPAGAILAPAAALQPFDTSGAGDAFNAGYLDARLGGAEPADAAATGHRLAGWVIMRPGAIPPLSALPGLPATSGE